MAGFVSAVDKAFATLYRDFAAVIRGEVRDNLPALTDALEGMRFISAAIASSAADAKWIALDDE